MPKENDATTYMHPLHLIYDALSMQLYLCHILNACAEFALWNFVLYCRTSELFSAVCLWREKKSTSFESGERFEYVCDLRLHYLYIICISLHSKAKRQVQLGFQFPADLIALENEQFLLRLKSMCLSCMLWVVWNV